MSFGSSSHRCVQASKVVAEDRRREWVRIPTTCPETQKAPGWLKKAVVHGRVAHDHLEIHTEGGDLLEKDEEFSKVEMLLAEFFEKAEDVIEDGGSSGEFMMTLAKFLGHFHNRHYPPSLHGFLTGSFAEAILLSASELRKVESYSKEMHLVLIHGNKK